ncbi:PstS family phosphate ABC transporter substrate-binding protein [Mesoterricola silvestris]|uniref:Phosphate ABC transporter substrate-binding protein n=1 Tax=Mesoterricola silvestris TaxID=2927979 RepID=A0AA48GYJ7_9BACT|nr:substrate-binding domain-containing protein [Mesoterricola silvestris]BDU74236.1 phosphate ABC transporter substrate-binding protein [Mesoterricola silvestris]
MGKPHLFAALALCLAAGSPALQAQTAQVRAKVSSTLLSYVPATQVTTHLEIPGTDALSDLGDEWNRVFRQFQPKGGIAYVAKVTKDAAKDLAEGTRPLIITARELTPEEMKAFQTKFGYLPMRIPVCMDALIVFVHKNNSLSSITMEQLDAIYSRDRLGGAKEPIKEWSDLRVRGDLGKREIRAYARAEGTAIRDSFQASVLLKGPYRPGLIPKDDSASLAEAVVTDEAGIAFGSLSSWYAGVKVLAVVPYKGSDARFPTQENVTTSRYPMPRTYYAYVNRAPGQPLDPTVNEVLHFILSQDGQSSAADVGILPAPPEFLAIALKRLER